MTEKKTNDELRARIEEALAGVELVRGAKARYTVLLRDIRRLKNEEALLALDSVANMVERTTLEREASRLEPIVKSPAEFMAAALENLRAVNGVFTRSVVTREIGEITLQRLADGYSINQVAMMIGCTRGTVSQIKSGRYRYSDLPPEVLIGSRGRSPAR